MPVWKMSPSRAQPNRPKESRTAAAVWDLNRRKGNLECWVAASYMSARIIGSGYRASKPRVRNPLSLMNPTKPPLTLLIAAPRGFCAGVDRAIRIVELALERYGAPVYVRHEIVHNKFVVDSLKAKGAVFVPELDQVPDGVPVVLRLSKIGRAH